MSHTMFFLYGLIAGVSVVSALLGSKNWLGSLPGYTPPAIAAVAIVGWLSLIWLGGQLAPTPGTAMAFGAFFGAPVGLALFGPVRKLLRLA